MNVAFTCNGLSRLTEEELFKVLGAPKSEKLARRNGKPLDEGVPNQLVKVAGWVSWIDEDDEDLRIFDLGEGFLKGAEPKMLAQPRDLKAPETIFTDSYDYRLDLWRAGIMVRTLRLKTF
jgi:serine/threonine-protein kinase SRPK3